MAGQRLAAASSSRSAEFNSVFLVASEAIALSGGTMKIVFRAAFVTCVLAFSTMMTGAWAASAKTTVQLVWADGGNTADAQKTVGALQTAIIEHAGADFLFIGRGDNSPHVITVTIYAGNVISTPTGMASTISADFISQSGFQARSKTICELPVGNSASSVRTLQCVDQFMATLGNFVIQMATTVPRTPMRVVAASADANESALVSVLKAALRSSPFFVEQTSGDNPQDLILVTVTSSAGSFFAQLRFAVQLSGSAGSITTSAECPPNAMDRCVAQVLQNAVGYQNARKQSGR